MFKTLFWTQSRPRLKLFSSSEEGNLNWLFLPGGPGLGAESLLPLLKILQLTGKPWLLDLPGDGSNTTSNNQESFKSWPVALIEAAKSFTHVVLVAHSTGGMYALFAEKLALECYETFDEKRRELEKQIADDTDRAILKELQAISQSAEALVKNT